MFHVTHPWKQRSPNFAHLGSAEEKLLATSRYDRPRVSQSEAEKNKKRFGNSAEKSMLKQCIFVKTFVNYLFEYIDIEHIHMYIFIFAEKKFWSQDYSMRFGAKLSV